MPPLSLTFRGFFNSRGRNTKRAAGPHGKRSLTPSTARFNGAGATTAPIMHRCGERGTLEPLLEARVGLVRQNNNFLFFRGSRSAFSPVCEVLATAEGIKWVGNFSTGTAPPEVTSYSSAAAAGELKSDAARVRLLLPRSGRVVREALGHDADQSEGKERAPGGGLPWRAGRGGGGRCLPSLRHLPLPRCIVGQRQAAPPHSPPPHVR